MDSRPTTGEVNGALLQAPCRLLFSLSPLLLPASPSPHAVSVYRNEPCVAATFYD